MHLRGGELALYATDLSNFLGCRHRTALDMSHAFGKKSYAKREDPLLDLLIRRGLEHERRFVDSLGAGAAMVVDIPSEVREDERIATTLQAMRDGADLIVQGGLRHGVWNGRPDVMLRVPVKSDLGDWSYEIYDTKLARETKAGTVLQLCLYSELLASAQGTRPEHFHVITPDAETEVPVRRLRGVLPPRAPGDGRGHEPRRRSARRDVLPGAGGRVRRVSLDRDVCVAPARG